MGLLRTVGVLGLLFAGYLGIWRLASLFPTARARIAALVVYAAVPLPSQLLSSGRWGALACYATVPWVVHLLRRSAGIESFDNTRADVGRTDLNRADGWLRCRPVPLADAVPTRTADGCGVRLRTVVRSRGRSARRRPGVTTLWPAGSWRVGCDLTRSLSPLGGRLVANLPWSRRCSGGRVDVIAGVPSPVACLRPVRRSALGVSRLARFGLGKPVRVPALALFCPCWWPPSSPAAGD